MKNVLVLLIIVTLFLISGCSDENIISDDNTVANNSVSNKNKTIPDSPMQNLSKDLPVGKYTSGILEAFDNQTQVGVIVVIKDNSNITVTGTKEERRALLLEKDAWFRPVVDGLIKDLPVTQVIDIRLHSGGFGAYITKEGFYFLVNDERVEQVIWVTTGGHATGNNNITYPYYDTQILEEFNRTRWVNVIIYLKNNTEAHTIFSTMSEDEINIIRETPTMITANVSEKGFNKLVNDERIASIYYNFEVSAS